MGGEESYGYLVGDHIRDKDAVVSCLMFAEMAAHYKQMGKSLYDVLIEIYETYGFYRERLISVKREGKKGAEEIAQMMEDFRTEPPLAFADRKVVVVKDYQTGRQRDLRTGKETDLGLPSSNVLQFVTEEEDVISVRPSGTEPKIKFYLSVKSELAKGESYRETVHRMDKLLDKMASDLNA